MLRWLVLIALAVLIYRVLDAAFRLLAKGGSPPRRVSGGGELVACDTCGVHVPAARTVRAGGKRYCSEACRRRHA